MTMVNAKLLAVARTALFAVFASTALAQPMPQLPPAPTTPTSLQTPSGIGTPPGTPAGNLQLDESLALTNYTSAAAALEAAKIDATRKLKSLAIVENATTPDSASYPRYLYDMITIIVVCLLVYTVVRLTIATILEHRD